jgi:hypothetical protein
LLLTYSNHRCLFVLGVSDGTFLDPPETSPQRASRSSFHTGRSICLDSLWRQGRCAVANQARTRRRSVFSSIGLVERVCRPEPKSRRGASGDLLDKRRQVGRELHRRPPKSQGLRRLARGRVHMSAISALGMVWLLDPAAFGVWQAWIALEYRGSSDFCDW